MRNAGLGDERDREEATHDVIVQLLVSPGQLFAGYKPPSSGPMEAWFSLSVRNAVRNVLRSRRRREPMNRAIGVGAAEAVPDRRRPVDDDVMAAFLKFLRAEVGEDAVRLLMVKMEEELSQRDLIRHPEFAGMGEWRIRRLMVQIRDAARAFAERQGDDAILATIARLTAPTRKDEWAGQPAAWLAA